MIEVKGLIISGISILCEAAVALNWAHLIKGGAS